MFHLCSHEQQSFKDFLSSYQSFCFYFEDWYKLSPVICFALLFCWWDRSSKVYTSEYFSHSYQLYFHNELQFLRIYPKKDAILEQYWPTPESASYFSFKVLEHYFMVKYIPSRFATPKLFFKQLFKLILDDQYKQVKFLLISWQILTSITNLISHALFDLALKFYHNILNDSS
jgi:hypothetical protein